MEEFHLPTKNSTYKPTLTAKAFKKNPDGSWTSIVNSDIPTAYDGLTRVGAGYTFQKGRKYWGVDVVAMIEQSASN